MTPAPGIPHAPILAVAFLGLFDSIAILAGLGGLGARDCGNEPSLLFLVFFFFGIPAGLIGIAIPLLLTFCVKTFRNPNLLVHGAITAVLAAVSAVLVVQGLQPHPHLASCLY